MMKFLVIAAVICFAQAIPMDSDKLDLSDKKKVAIRELTVASSVPLNVSEWAVNPCETTRNFNYFVAYPNDTARFIQCDPWGTGIVKTCVEGTVWNIWSLCCEQPSNIHNMTLALPQRVFNCSLSGRECLHEGVCTESSLGGDRCVCTPKWTGPSCETRVDLLDLTHEILNGTFSICEFRKRLQAANVSVDVSTYARYKDQLDNATYSELMSYMDLYEGNEIRYDTLINNLVESILEDIYPDAAYLATFNSSSISVVELVQLIPNLMSYSKYSLERYEDVFAKYQQVLSRLIAKFNSPKASNDSILYQSNSTHSKWQSNGHFNGTRYQRLRQEAEQYTRLTSIFMNQTLAVMNQSASGTFQNSENVNALIEGQKQQSQTQLTEKQIRDSLRTQFNATLTASQKLFASLEYFQNDVMELVKNGSRDVYTLTLEQSKLNGTTEVQSLLQQISSSGIQTWDQLVNYGFWYITSLLIAPSANADIARDIVNTIATPIV